MSTPEPKKRGRPRVSEPRSNVHAWVPTPTHDRIIRLASAQNMTVSGFVSKLLTHVVGPRRP
jgi:hypothetical protein